MKNKIVLLAPKDNAFYNFRKEVILALKELGHEIILVCPYGKKIDYFTDRGCKFINFNLNRRGKNPFSDFVLMTRYRKVIAETKANLVLTYTTKCSVYGGMAATMEHIPCIINNSGLKETQQSQVILRFVLNTLYKVGFRKASMLMFQNKHEAKVINTILNYKVPFQIIPGSGVNLNEFIYKDYPSEDNGIIFNYVARIVDIKGISEFLECAKQIKHKYNNTHFIIYGDYDDDRYREKIGVFIEKGIVEYGGIQMDMRPKITVAHAVIHPSYYEGMTNVCLEHSAMGRVCIASDIPGCREIINNGVTGFTFKVKDVDDMVQKVEQFILLPHEQKVQMGIAARAKMEKEFDRNIVIDAYLKEVTRLLKEL